MMPLQKTVARQDILGSWDEIMMVALGQECHAAMPCLVTPSATGPSIASPTSHRNHKVILFLIYI